MQKWFGSLRFRVNGFRKCLWVAWTNNVIKRYDCKSRREKLSCGFSCWLIGLDLAFGGVFSVSCVKAWIKVFQTCSRVNSE